MKKTYEKPIAEVVDFNIKDSIMSGLQPLDNDIDPSFSSGVEEW